MRLDLDLKKMKAAASDGAVNGFMVKSLADCDGYSNPKNRQHREDSRWNRFRPASLNLDRGDVEAVNSEDGFASAEVALSDVNCDFAFLAG